MQCTLKRAGVANHRVPRQQRGVAAIEFMLIMAVLLPAFYVGVAFAVTLLAQQMVTQATAEGARAALRGCSLADRENLATQAVRNGLSWPAVPVGQPQFVQDTQYPCPADGTTSASTPAQCILHVTLSVKQQLVANWPGLGDLIPQTLNASAAVTLNTSDLGAGSTCVSG